MFVELTKPDHAGFNAGGNVRSFHRLHVEEDRFVLVGFGLGQQRMQQDATPRVDQERVGTCAEMEVDDRTEQRVDRYVHARDALEVGIGSDRQTRRRHHPCHIVMPESRQSTNTTTRSTHIVV